MANNLKATTGLIEHSSERNLIIPTIRLVAVFPILVGMFSGPAAVASTTAYAAILTYTLGFLWLENRSRHAGRSARLALAGVDIAVAVALVLITGGVFGPFYFYSLGSIITAEALVGPAQSIIAGAIVAVAYVAGSLLFMLAGQSLGGTEQLLLVEKLIGYWLIPVLVSDRPSLARLIKTSADAAGTLTTAGQTAEGEITKDQSIKARQDAAQGLQASLDKDEIVDRLFKALMDTIGVSGYFNLGFIKKAERVITDWHSLSPLDDRAVSYVSGNTRVPLDGDSQLAKAALERSQFVQISGGKSKLVIPLACNGRTLAVLEVAMENRNLLTEAKIGMIRSLCDQAAVALKNAQTLNSAREEAEKLSSLYEISGQLLAKRVPERVIALVADHAKRLPQSEKVVAWLTNSNSRIDAKSMVVRGCRRTLPEKAWRADLIKLARSILKKKKPAIVRRFELPAYISGASPTPVFVLGIPLMSKDRVNGVLIAMTSQPRRYGKDEITTLSLLGQIAGRAIENASLYQRTKKLAAFEERYRIAMDLHDGLAQALFSIALNLEVCQRSIAQDPSDVKKRLVGLQDLTLETLKETRRYILELQPDGAMADALPNIIRDYVRKFNHSNGIKVRSSVRGKPISELPISVKQNLYRILQEALANIVKHSKATEAKVHLLFADYNIELTVEDNGIGFPTAGLNAGKTSPAGMGLMNMHKRADMIGGTLILDSLPGQGSKVLVKVPANGDSHDN